MTDVAILVLCGLFVVTTLTYEIYALITHKPLITARVRYWSKKYPIIPFVLGLIIGAFACHFFWF